MHHQTVVDEIEGVRARLEWVRNHFAHWERVREFRKSTGQKWNDFRAASELDLPKSSGRLGNS